MILEHWEDGLNVVCLFLFLDYEAETVHGDNFCDKKIPLGDELGTKD